MKTPAHSRSKGSTLLACLIVIAMLGFSIAAYYGSLIPKYRSTHQGAAWQEALHGAEAGADYTLSLLNTWCTSTTNPDAYPWTTNSWSYTNSLYTTNGERTLDGSRLPSLGGTSNVRGLKIAVDVYTREAIGSSPTYNPWFRIRSTARADLPGSWVSSDYRDIQLRRMKLGAKTGTGARDPYVTRTVEVIARPRYLFHRAIVTVNDMSLGNSANWRVDSFDSTDTNKSNIGTSAGGIYPGSGSAKVQSNGSIASAKQNPAASPYGPLITGNGAIIRGSVQTAGGDDPSTPAVFENVSGSSGMDTTRITSDFNEDIPVPTAPMWTSWTYQGTGPASYVTGTKFSPTRYAITGNLGSFAVIAPAAGTTGYIEIIVTANLSTGNGGGSGITIPPNVYASLWVQGNIDFGNGSINSNGSSSQVASHLIVYGISTAPSPTFSASGNATEILSLNAPNYTANLNGTVDTTGSFIVKNFGVNGGGNGGFHYDEAVGNSGPIAGWDVASNFEDTRTDL